MKWDTLTLPITKGGLGIIDPKTQSEVLFAKLLVRGLAPSREPWKELIRHHIDQTKLPVHGKGPDIPDINWIFAAPKLKRSPYSMWKSIMGAWINMRPGLTKEDPTSRAELLRQPLFGNLSLTNSRGLPLGVNERSEGCVFTRPGHTKVRDLWDREAQDWKNLSNLGMHFHASNRASKDIILENIPRRPNSFSPQAQLGDWVNISAPRSGELLEWVYYVMDALPDKVLALEFKRASANGQLRATSYQVHPLPHTNLSLVRVLSQERHDASLKVAGDPPSANHRSTTFWIFETGFVENLPWDLGEWHWKEIHPLDNVPFFGYTAKKGYKNTKGPSHSPGIINFINDLGLKNSTISQVVAKIWHNAHPKKVGTLIWLTLNQGLSTGTWM